MLADASSTWKPMPGAIYVYVSDTDTTYQRALQAGGTSLMEPADQFHGDRMAGVQDPFGNVWWIATHNEDVLPDELQKRADALS
jgi:PhnB protein